MRPNDRPAIDTRAPATGWFVRRLFTHTRLRVALTSEMAARSVTWRTVCREMPACVIVTTYQPAGSALGMRNQAADSSSNGWRRSVPRTTRPSDAVRTGVVLVRTVQSGAERRRR